MSVHVFKQYKVPVLRQDIVTGNTGECLISVRSELNLQSR